MDYQSEEHGMWDKFRAWFGLHEAPIPPTTERVDSDGVRRTYRSRTAEEVKRHTGAPEKISVEGIEDPAALTAPNSAMVDEQIAEYQARHDAIDEVQQSTLTTSSIEPHPITHVEGELRGRRPRDKGSRPMPSTAGMDVEPEAVATAAETAQEATDRAPRHPRTPQPAEAAVEDLEGSEWRVHAADGIVFVAYDLGREQYQFSPRQAQHLATALDEAGLTAHDQRQDRR